MKSNKFVLIGGAVIITVGVANAATNGGSPTKVIVGGLAFTLLASILELFGEGASALASGIVGVAVLTVVLTEAPGIAAAYTNAQKNVAKGTTSVNPNPANPPTITVSGSTYVPNPGIHPS